MKQTSDTQTLTIGQPLGILPLFLANVDFYSI